MTHFENELLSSNLSVVIKKKLKMSSVLLEENGTRTLCTAVVTLYGTVG
jgi:hypothetical protein